MKGDKSMKLKNNEKLKKLFLIVITLLTCLIMLSSLSFADVGSFESYDSGSDRGGIWV